MNHWSDRNILKCYALKQTQGETHTKQDYECFEGEDKKSEYDVGQKES